MNKNYRTSKRQATLIKVKVYNEDYLNKIAD